MWHLRGGGGMSDVRALPSRVRTPFARHFRWDFLLHMQFVRIVRRMRGWNTPGLHMGLDLVHRKYLRGSSRAQLPWPWPNRMRSLRLRGSARCGVLVQMLNQLLNSEVFFGLSHGSRCGRRDLPCLQFEIAGLVLGVR
jgi:hypothetical protein